MSIILGETPNPVPTCLGIMSHEQKTRRKQGICKYTVQISRSKWPGGEGVKQEVETSQKEATWNISNKKDTASSGKRTGSLLLHEEHDGAFPSGFR